MSLEGTISRPRPSPFPTRTESIALIKNQRVHNLVLPGPGEIVTSRARQQGMVVASATGLLVLVQELEGLQRSLLPPLHPCRKPLVMLRGAKRRNTEVATRTDENVDVQCFSILPGTCSPRLLESKPNFTPPSPCPSCPIP